jgi:hypothetical protein
LLAQGPLFPAVRLPVASTCDPTTFKRLRIHFYRGCIRKTGNRLYKNGYRYRLSTDI